MGKNNTADTTSRKLSISALCGLVLGTIAWILSAVPIILINNLARTLAVAGILLGIVGTLSVHNGKRRGKGVAMAAIVVSITALIISFAAHVVRNGLIG